MKKNISILFLLFFLLLKINSSSAQIICIFCYEQNDSISDNVNNLLLNGGFENHNCIPNNWFASSYCPNSAYYTCDIANWTCTGGGTSTYADICDINYSNIIEGSSAVYFGSYYCMACSTTPNDTSCLTSTDCTVGGIPVGYPNNDPVYGGAQGLSLEQTASGLTVGATYVLEFWAGGEGQPDPGLFAVDVGFGYTFLRNKPTTPFTGIGIRYIIEFNATATSHTIKFTNWGHITFNTTELILDDVKLYTLQELSPIVPPCAGTNTTAIFSAPNNICPGTCTDFQNLSINATSFLWTFSGGNPGVSTDINPANICYTTPGSYDVTLIASNATTSDTLTLANYITVYPWPAAQGILQNGDTLFANPGAVSYQWYENGSLIPGATNYFYVATESGNYNVVATDINNCEVEAVIFDVVAGISQFAVGSSQLTVYPVPAVNSIFIKGIAVFNDQPQINIYNVLGEKILPTTFFQNENQDYEVEVSKLSPGIYYLQIELNEKLFRVKFMKE